MLGALLLVAGKLGGQARVLRRRVPALAGARDRARGRVAPTQASQRLRRGAEDLCVAGVHVEHVWRGVRDAERPVEGDRRRSCGPRPPAREHDLEALPGPDLLARPHDRGEEPLVLGGDPPRRVGLRSRFGDRQGCRTCLVEGRRQDNFQAVQGGDGTLIRSLGALLDAHRGDQQEPLADAVEGRDHRVDREPCVGQSQRVRKVSWDPLDEAHDVVSEPANGSARERRQILEWRPVLAGDLSPQDVERRTRHLFPVDGRLGSPHRHDPRGIGAGERPPRNALASLDALQEERMPAGPGEPQQHPGRGHGVGRQLPNHGHEAVAAGQLDEPGARGPDHMLLLKASP